MIKCEKCKIVEIPEPQYCCNGYMCGCYGQPIDPPYCESCWKELSGEVKTND